MYRNSGTNFGSDLPILDKEKCLHEYMSAYSFLGVAGKYAFGSKNMICARGLQHILANLCEMYSLTCRAKQLCIAGQIAWPPCSSDLQTFYFYLLGHIKP
jgi:hypothetical protein